MSYRWNRILPNHKLSKYKYLTGSHNVSYRNARTHSRAQQLRAHATQPTRSIHRLSVDNNIIIVLSRRPSSSSIDPQNRSVVAKTRPLSRRRRNEDDRHSSHRAVPVRSSSVRRASGRYVIAWHTHTLKCHHYCDCYYFNHEILNSQNERCFAGIVRFFTFYMDIVGTYQTFLTTSAFGYYDRFTIDELFPDDKYRAAYTLYTVISNFFFFFFWHLILSLRVFATIMISLQFSRSWVTSFHSCTITIPPRAVKVLFLRLP